MVSAKQLIDIGISRGHAYDILARRQQPSVATALRIFDATGKRFGILEALDDEAIARLPRKAAA